MQKLQSFFIDQDTALHNEGMTTVGQMELVYEIYEMYLKFVRWAGRYNTKQTIKGLGELFFRELSKTINLLCSQV